MPRIPLVPLVNVLVLTRFHRVANYKTGEWTLEAIEERKWLRSLVRSFCKGSK
jgi:hypothetical protein